ncbi:MAG: class I SAM-dependent methyltransferase [Deltaproteobacteria bacterium]|nr:class I SAM-dependent methyltransferase [Deltaproteobacteria bacterium]
MDPWSDLVGLEPGKGLAEETKRFVKNWEDNNRICPSYQLVISDIRNFLEELSRWLQQTEVTNQNINEYDNNLALKKEFIEEVGEEVQYKLDELFMDFEKEASKISDYELSIHAAFAQRMLHPLILCSPFIHRTFTKPLGYAGDYKMVNMMLQDPIQGSSSYACLLNSFFINQAAAEAHRNRISILEEQLDREIRSSANKGKPFRVMNIGCGPAVEIQKYLKRNRLMNHCHFKLIDFNEETISYTRESLQNVVVPESQGPYFEFVHKSIHELLKEAVSGNKNVKQETFDMIYCAGLFDYLSDRVCKRLLDIYYDRLSSGGLLIVTNVHPRNPFRQFMTYLLEWHLIYRDESQMERISPKANTKRIYTDATGVNVFLEIRKENN